MINTENTGIKRFVATVAGGCESSWAGPGTAEIAFDIREIGLREAGG